MTHFSEPQTKESEGGEIEITQEMIEAGALALLDYFDDLSLVSARGISMAIASSILGGGDDERCSTDMQ